MRRCGATPLRGAAPSARLRRMERYFNIAGPCVPGKHYMIPALERLPEVARLIDREQSFVIHAARQSGKTTALMALVRDINAKEKKRAVYFTLEGAQRYPNPQEGIPVIVSSMRSGLLHHRIFGGWAQRLPVVESSTGNLVPALSVKDFLSSLAVASDRPLVVLFDEVDCLSDDTLITFLRQLRDGIVSSRAIDPDSYFPFPVSVALVGMRDVRDYLAHVRPDSESLGTASPFNVKTESLGLANFTEGEVAALYAQHTEDTGQVFEPEAIADAWRLTRGQPWLVNAIARQCVEKIHKFDYSATVTEADVEEAKEALARERGTHVDSLMERLKEPRVRRVVEPVILGLDRGAPRNGDDYRYALDLGLLREENGALLPGNPMYAEILLRYLSYDEQEHFRQVFPTPFWLAPDGSLDMPALMAGFQRFWRENSGADREVYGYKEATPHLVMNAYLQRIVNGGGHIAREMALGSKRLDLCVEFGRFRYAVELKMRNQLTDASYAQLAGYLDTLGLAEGWMTVFDPDPAKSWDEKIYTRDEISGGKTIHVVGV